MNHLNIVYHNTTVTQQRREKLNKRKSVVIWFTGLSDSNKSTLTHSVEEELYKIDCRAFVLDGDNVRHSLSTNLTFSDYDCKENVRRIGEVVKLMMGAGIIAITAFISQFREDRDVVSKLLQQKGLLNKWFVADPGYLGSNK
jgi:adenylylsulfate kinase